MHGPTTYEASRGAAGWAGGEQPLYQLVSSRTERLLAVRLGVLWGAINRCRAVAREETAFRDPAVQFCG
jgi:hypothetical protein